jgi:hypothetical protein
MLGGMSILDRIKSIVRPAPKPEDLEASREAARIRDQVDTTRLSTRGGSGAENYQSGRGQR